MRQPHVYTPYEMQHWPTSEEFSPGLYRSARPLMFMWSLHRSLYVAWQVFLGRYDALNWNSTQGYERMSSAYDQGVRETYEECARMADCADGNGMVREVRGNALLDRKVIDELNAALEQALSAPSPSAEVGGEAGSITLSFEERDVLHHVIQNAQGMTWPINWKAEIVKRTLDKVMFSADLFVMSTPSLGAAGQEKEPKKLI